MLSVLRPRSPVSSEDLAKLLHQLATQSQAGEAIVAAAVIEDRLQQLLLAAMRPQQVRSAPF